VIAEIATVAALVLAASSATPAAAQTSWEDAHRGVVAYRALDYVEAISQFRQTLASARGSPLSDSLRAAIQTYIGASEVHLQRPSAAATAFWLALAAEPRFRIDTLIFPPPVTQAFEEVRSRSRFTRVVAARDTSFELGVGEAHFRVYASAPHRVEVDLCRSAGSCEIELLRAEIADSVVVRWDGFDASGTAPLQGSVELRVRSGGGGDGGRELRVPLTVTAAIDAGIARTQSPRLEGPTALAASASASTDAAPARARWRALAVGLLVGAGAIYLPELVSESEPGGDGRFVVGAVVAGISMYGLPGVGTRADRSSGALTPPPSADATEDPRVRIRIVSRSVAVMNNTSPRN
jgi:hypothetical protein